MRKTSKAFIAAVLGLGALTGSAAAAKMACIDPRLSYVAHPLNNHEIYVESSFGPKKPPVRVSTSCYHLQPAIGFGLSAEFGCLSLGDTVVATTMGDRQACRVTKVQPYAPLKDDLPLPKKD